MKSVLIIALLSTIAPSAHSALYTLNNGSGSTAAGIETTDGKVFRSGTTDGDILGISPQNVQISAGPGIVEFGFFSTDDFSAVSDPTTLVSLFTRFGATATFGGASTGGNRSVFSSAQNQTIVSTYSTKSIYLFVGNGATYETSTQFLISKMDSATFIAGDDVTNAVTPKVITINPGNSSVLLGSEIANVWTTNTDASTTAGWQMATLIPEPSTFLLASLGVLGLLRRRR